MIKYGFQSSKYDNLNLEQEIQFSDNNKTDFFDIFFDDYVPLDIVKVQLPENYTVHLPLGFAKLAKEYQQPYFDFIKNNHPATVTIHFSELTMESMEYVAANVNDAVLCIENTIPDRNEFTNSTYIDFMIEAQKYAAEKGFKIYATFDTGHAKINGFEPLEYVQKIISSGIDIYTVHLHDNDGHDDQHRPAGSIYNGINFSGVIECLGRIKHDVYAVIEHWNNNYNALEYLRNLQN